MGNSPGDGPLIVHHPEWYLDVEFPEVHSVSYSFKGLVTFESEWPTHGVRPLQGALVYVFDADDVGLDAEDSADDFICHDYAEVRYDIFPTTTTRPSH